MKIGVLTFTEGYNYGNKLQNYAMLTYLQNNFPCEVKTVNNCIAQGSKLEKARILLTWAIPSKSIICIGNDLSDLRRLIRNT